MATLLDGRMIVTTAAGVRISGGKLRIYNTGTTTLSSVYSDSGLSVPLTNPVVADSAGVLPEVYGAEGTIVDCTMLTAGDVAISGRAWTLAFLGSNTGSITRDFTNSRFAVRGSGGTVYIEAGDPTGDNTGGTMRLGGWNGTQADTLTLDSAAIDTTGLLTEKTKKLPGIVTTAATTFTAAATVDIALTADPAGTRAWELTLFDLIGSASLGVYFRFSYDGGATYKSAAGDYQSVHNLNTGVNVATSFSDMAAQTSILMRATLTSTANRIQLIRATIITPPSGADSTALMGDSLGYNASTGDLQRSSFGGMGIGGYGKATHVRVGFNSGTCTGKYRLESQRGYGE